MLMKLTLGVPPSQKKVEKHWYTIEIEKHLKQESKLSTDHRRLYYIRNQVNHTWKKIYGEKLSQQM